MTNTPLKGKHSFTDLFIADNYQRKGYRTKAVKAILERFIKDGQAEMVEIQVHESNEFAIKSYISNGFKVISRAEWDDAFLVMSYNLARKL